MPRFVLIDCGSTNSRAFVTDEHGTVLGKARKKVGVIDTATSGSKETLRQGLREIIAASIADAALTEADITAVLSSGMITSEIGLAELPHLDAPADGAALAAAIERVDPLGITETPIPIYFVRGIRNPLPGTASQRPTAAAEQCDFMRGEEVQMLGILSELPADDARTVLVLSSHSKFVPIDENGRILGSYTTMSGQIYDAVQSGTLIGKSVRRGDEAPAPADFFDPAIVSDAMQQVERFGLIRTLFLPRFLDVLLDTVWYERHLFYEAAIAADDIRGLHTLPAPCLGDFLILGQPSRCRLYAHLLSLRFPKARIRTVSDTDAIDRLSIAGLLAVARGAGLTES